MITGNQRPRNCWKDDSDILLWYVTIEHTSSRAFRVCIHPQYITLLISLCIPQTPSLRGYEPKYAPKLTTPLTTGKDADQERLLKQIRDVYSTLQEFRMDQNCVKHWQARPEGLTKTTCYAEPTSAHT